MKTGYLPSELGVIFRLGNESSEWVDAGKSANGEQRWRHVRTRRLAYGDSPPGSGGEKKKDDADDTIPEFPPMPEQPTNSGLAGSEVVMDEPEQPSQPPSQPQLTAPIEGTGGVTQNPNAIPAPGQGDWEMPIPPQQPAESAAQAPPAAAAPATPQAPQAAPAQPPASPSQPPGQPQGQLQGQQPPEPPQTAPAPVPEPSADPATQQPPSPEGGMTGNEALQEGGAPEQTAEQPAEQQTSPSSPGGYMPTPKESPGDWVGSEISTIHGVPGVIDGVSGNTLLVTLDDGRKVKMQQDSLAVVKNKLGEFHVEGEDPNALTKEQADAVNTGVKQAGKDVNTITQTAVGNVADDLKVGAGRSKRDKSASDALDEKRKSEELARQRAERAAKRAQKRRRGNQPQ